MKLDNILAFTSLVLGIACLVVAVIVKIELC